ncbi:hypothetical protein N2152v2_002038 [Parachlorella kessleri]
MVSTRSRSALNSGDAAVAAAQGQPEVSSTPRRSSSRLAGRGTSTPSGRTRQTRTASKAKAAELASILESPQQQQQQQQQAGQAQEQAADEQQHVGQQSQPPAPELQQQPGEEAQADSQPQQQPQASPPVSVGQPGTEEPGETVELTEREGSDSQGPSETDEHADGERQPPGADAEQQPAGEAASPNPAMQPALRLGGLGADASLLDKVAAEMFAALADTFGDAESDQGGSDESSRSSSGDEGEESGESDEEDVGEQRLEQGQEETGRAAAAAAAVGTGGGGYTVPRHLRWEPELALPGQAAPHHRRPQGRPQQKQSQQQEPLAKQLHALPRDERALQKARHGAAPDTAGKQWFDLPATAITDEVKRDLRMLRLRTAFDPKAFYKKLDSTKFPKHFQVGTVVEGAADFYSARLTKGERKRTFTEEVMADPHLAEVRNKRFSKLQEEKSYWANKKAARKTENERLKKKPRKPKH